MPCSSSTRPAPQPLSSLDEPELTDALLDAIWRETEDLGRAVVSHGSLGAEQIVVDAVGTPAIGSTSPPGPWARPPPTSRPIVRRCS